MFYLTLAAIAVGAAVQSATGNGFGLVCAPFLIAYLGPRDGVPAALLLSSAANVLVFAKEARHFKPRPMLWLLIPALIATPVVAIAVRHVDSGPLAVLGGVLILIAVFALAMGRSSRRLGGPAAAMTAGTMSATMNVIAGISGPPALIYAINSGWSPKMTRPTLQVYFLLLNIAALISLGRFPPVNIFELAAIAAGWGAGWFVINRISEVHLRYVTLAVAGLGAMIAIVRGLTG